MRVFNSKQIVSSQLLKFYRSFFVVLFLLQLTTQAFAQNTMLHFEAVNNPVLQQYNIRHVNTGADGKLWLSTSNGLLSYDGTEVHVFKHDDNVAGSLSSDDVLRTYTDATGNLYVMEVSLKVDYFNTKTGKAELLYIAHEAEDFRLMAYPSAYPDLLTDTDGSIWLAVSYVGLVHFDKHKKQTDTYYLEKNVHSRKKSVNAVKQDSANQSLLWLATENGVYSFNKVTKLLQRKFQCARPADSSAEDLNIRNIELINKDTILFSVPGKGLGFYDIKTGRYKIFPVAANGSLADVFELARKDRFNYYIATPDKLPGVFNTRNQTCSFPSSPNTSILLNDFLIDKQTNFWCIIHNRLFKEQERETKFSTILLNKSIDSMTAGDFKKIIWNEKKHCYYTALENNYAILVLDSNFGLRGKIPFHVSDKRKQGIPVYDIAIDKNNRLWVCSDKLYVYDYNSDALVEARKWNQNLSALEFTFQNMVVRGDYIYLQPVDHGNKAIYRIDAGSFTYDSILLPKELIITTANETQPWKEFNYLVVDQQQKNAYIGYNKNSALGNYAGLIQIDLETLKARRVATVNLKERDNFINLFFNYALDDKNRIWLETESGIKIFDPEKLQLTQTIQTGNKNFSKQMVNIDHKGMMCALTTDGIVLYDYLSGKKRSLAVGDGLISVSNTALAYTNNMIVTGGDGYMQYLPVYAALNKNSRRKCYLSSIALFNKPYQTDTLPQYMRFLNLQHDQNFLTFNFSSIEFAQPEGIEYRYKLERVDKDWNYVNYLNRTISYNDLDPGTYRFKACVKNEDGTWTNNDINLTVIISPAWWQTTLFRIVLFIALVLLAFSFVQWRINFIRKQEQLKGKYEKELLELEAKALRAQMNPHFIFNCMNSIKTLIQSDEQDKAVIYLTTFSKLIRTIFQNSDKRAVSLYDEIETCRLYTELESMRFDNKFSYEFAVDASLDLKSVMVPALIIQPFIENAIWHGIMPKEDGGHLKVTLTGKNGSIFCTIDDTGIGREMSKQNKFKGDMSTHQSKGVHLTQARLDLNNLLTQRNAFLNITDKKDEHGSAAGTLVILEFRED